MNVKPENMISVIQIINNRLLFIEYYIVEHSANFYKNFSYYLYYSYDIHVSFATVYSKEY